MIGRLTLCVVLQLLGAMPVLGQSLSVDTIDLPSVVLNPAPVDGQTAPIELPSVVNTPTATGVLDGLAQPTINAAGLGVDISEMRSRFEDLQRRDVALQALRAPASPETLAEISRLDEETAHIDAELTLTTWRAQNLTILAQALATSPEVTLPASIVAGVTPKIALAVIRAQNTLYSEPRADAAAVIRTLDTVTTMLRVAETGSFTLVWSPQDRFAFVLSTVREVY
jgi:hypothetical protein